MEFLKEPKDIVLALGNKFMQAYWGKIYQFLKDNPQYIEKCPGFLINPERIIFYLTKTHLGVEYFGNEKIIELPKGGKVDFGYQNLTGFENWFEEIIGFSYRGTAKVKLFLPSITVNLILPTNEAVTKLSELHWNWAAQSSMLCFNCSGIEIKEKEFYRLVNSIFFDVRNDSLITRRIKWLDLIPISYKDEGDGQSFGLNLSIYSNELYKMDCQTGYPLPTEFKYQQLEKVNRFVEFIGDTSHSEPEITKLLSQEEFNFILKMAFFGKEVYSYKECHWQSVEKDVIIPDFFIVKPDGYADIVEFKLPQLKGTAIVGTRNREAFSAEINSYIAQTRVYEEYFDDSANRQWIEKEHGFKVLKPKRYLVIGRRWDLSAEELRKIQSDYRNIEIISYDGLVDGVVSQFYAK